MPLALSAVAVLVEIAPPDALAYGAQHGLRTLAAAGVACAAALALACLIDRRGRPWATAAFLLIAVYAASVLLVTGLTPSAQTADELAQRAVTSLWVVLGLLLLGAARRRELPADVATVILRFGGGLLGAAAFKAALLDAPFFGAGGSAVLAALIAALAIPVVLREARAHAWLAIPGVALALPAQVVLLQLAPPDALAYGADRLALVGAAGVVAGGAAIAVALLIEERLRLACALAAQLVCLYAASVFLVSALTDQAGHAVQADQLAQVALSVLWTVWGIALLAWGVRGASALAVAHRTPASCSPRSPPARCSCSTPRTWTPGTARACSWQSAWCCSRARTCTRSSRAAETGAAAILTRREHERVAEPSSYRRMALVSERRWVQNRRVRSDERLPLGGGSRVRDRIGGAEPQSRAS